jgi:hypothetical protein
MVDGIVRSANITNEIAVNKLKDRNYGLNGSYVGLYFNGATNYFEELPPADEFKKNPELYKQYI